MRPAAEKLGVLGGSFNPIHIGHLIIAEAAYESLNLDEVLFIPAKQPPHKPSEKLAPAVHRCNMVRLAIRGNDRFRISTMEIRRRSPSYSIDTITQLRRARPSADIFFIIGADTILELHTWKRIRDLATLCTFAVAVRPGFSLRRLDDLRAVLGEEAVAAMKASIIRVPPIGVSSTDIRRRIAEGRSIRYLVPAAVERYIREKGLYLPRR